MEKSIEKIWKEGFSAKENLDAPQLLEFQNQKSKQITERFKRMAKINLILILCFSVIFLIVTAMQGLAILGITWFLVLSIVFLVNNKLLKDFDTLNYTMSSYDYLKSFYSLVQKHLAINRKLARIYYPMFFLSMVLGFWFVNDEGIPLGERLIGEIHYGFPDLYEVNGIPLILIIILIAITGLLAYFGGRIYNFDVKIVYGRMFKKIEALIADMEDLQKNLV